MAFLDNASVFLLEPLGTGADDWPRLIATLQIYAYNRPVALGAGTWFCNSASIALEIPSGSTIIGNPGVSIVQSLPFTGGHTNTAFSRDDLSRGTVLGTVGGSGIAAGSKTQTLGTGLAIAVDDTIAFVNGNQAASYTVEAYNSGTGAITLDRVAMFAFPSNTQVINFVQPVDIHIQGNGMRMSGTGDRYVSIVSGWRCSMSGIYVEESLLGEYCFSFDTASRQTVMEHMRVDKSATTAFATEGAESCVIRECWAENVNNNPAFLMQACYDCQIVDCHSRGTNGSGVSFGFFSDTVGCRGCSVIGGSHVGNTIGVSIDGGTRDCEFVGLDVSYNSTAGILVSNSNPIPQTPARLRFANIRAVGCGFGVLIDGATGCYGDNIYVEGSTTNAIRVQEAGELSVSNFEATENTVTIAVQCFDTSVLRLISGKITSTKVAGINGIQSANTSRCEVSNFVVQNNAAVGIGYVCAGGLLTLDNCRTIGCSIGSYAGGFGSNASVRYGMAVDVSSATTQFVNDTLGAHNFGTVVAAGAGAVAVSFPNMKTTDRVVLTRQTDGGAVGNTPRVTITANTGFSINGTALDTSTYAFKIV